MNNIFRRYYIFERGLIQSHLEITVNSKNGSLILGMSIYIYFFFIRKQWLTNLSKRPGNYPPPKKKPRFYRKLWAKGSWFCVRDPLPRARRACRQWDRRRWGSSTQTRHAASSPSPSSRKPPSATSCFQQGSHGQNNKSVFAHKVYRYIVKAHSHITNIL